MDPATKRRLFEKYASGAVLVETKDADGVVAIGSAFHIGEGLYVTARHVVEKRTIMMMCATESSIEQAELSGAKRFDVTHAGGQGRLLADPYFHPDPLIDLAILQIGGIDSATLEFGFHLDDWIGSDMLLMDLILLGYPRVPFTRHPVLVVVSGEINAVVDLYARPKAHFIVSQTARGGFSGGPALTEHGFVLGVVTESLLQDHAAVESGFCAVLSIEAIYECLAQHKIMPAKLRAFLASMGSGELFDSPPPVR